MAAIKRESERGTQPEREELTPHQVSSTAKFTVGENNEDVAGWYNIVQHLSQNILTQVSRANGCRNKWVDSSPLACPSTLPSNELILLGKIDKPSNLRARIILRQVGLDLNSMCWSLLYGRGFFFRTMRHFITFINKFQYGVSSQTRRRDQFIRLYVCSNQSQTCEEMNE